MHFWDRSLMPYTWLHEVPSIWERHAFENLRAEIVDDRADSSRANLPEKIVFVEAGAPWLEEIKWVEQLAAAEPHIAGMVAKLAINAGAQTSADIAEVRRHPLVRGVRHHFEHEPLDYCRRPEFIAGVRQLAAANLSFDICCKHPQMPAVIELAQSCPDVQFILDHGGKPGIRAGLLDPWRDDIRRLVTLPNVVCKLSGLVNEADHRHWNLAQLMPYATHLLETFGPGRLLFGGDWPVARLASTYERWLATARQITAHLSAAEQQSIFSDNAKRIYRL